MYADTTVNNLQATLPLISQLSGQQQEVAQKLKDDWRFFVAQTEKSDPKKVFEDAQYLHLRKPAYLQESGDGERLYQSLMALSADRLMEQQATNIQVRAILADHVPLLEKLSPEQLRDLTQYDATRDNLYNSSACHAAFNIMKTPSLIQKILNSDLPDGFLWTLPDLRVQTYASGAYDSQFDMEFAYIVDDVLKNPELHRHMQPKHLIALAQKKIEYASYILRTTDVDVFETVLNTPQDKYAFLQAVVRKHIAYPLHPMEDRATLCYTLRPHF
ncbi:hypothetical protein CAGGBEG34_230067 [Candidatus Glomeribacter gigasporarum BEG34]|uniref:Uncharacterized protein n=1 Tax=Candidatus Glomeribacter gigasporarum BEG34 TaxID=1070319 RepID=G2J9H7_9BURK|nr:hypothetical protein [Candidatus Glomeribacter gigasporarum]CCD29424.1 hypothetical protein CAGGBEG34_230067 [Candidatus Glomeribacter gigasporarum BEG34]